MDSRNKELYEAVKQGNENKVKDLISQGANVNWHNPDYYEWTPLHRACRDRNILLAKLLISNGADVNAKVKLSTNSTQTPLHTVAFWGYEDVVTVLLQNGVDRNIRSNNDTDNHTSYRNKTAHEYAIVKLEEEKAKKGKAHRVFEGIVKMLDPNINVSPPVKSPQITPQPQSLSEMQVWVQFGNQEDRISLEGCEYVADLRDKIHERFGIQIPSPQLKIKLKGRTLNPGDELRDLVGELKYATNRKDPDFQFITLELPQK